MDQLISAKNRERKRNLVLKTSLLKPDSEMERYLAYQNMDISSVPPTGQRVRLRDKANISGGGDIVDVTDQWRATLSDLLSQQFRLYQGSRRQVWMSSSERTQTTRKSRNS